MVNLIYFSKRKSSAISYAGCFAMFVSNTCQLLGRLLAYAIFVFSVGPSSAAGPYVCLICVVIHILVMSAMASTDKVRFRRSTQGIIIHPTVSMPKFEKGQIASSRVILYLSVTSCGIEHLIRTGIEWNGRHFLSQ
jgi:hypothetical protein